MPHSLRATHRKQTKGKNMTDKSKRIAQQNDAFRSQTAMAIAYGIEGQIVHTASLSQYNAEEMSLIAMLVQTYDTFNENNDPYGEHDFGSFTFKDKKFFWKIDYYDCKYEYGSSDPADPKITRRVLTIMHAEDY